MPKPSYRNLDESSVMQLLSTAVILAPGARISTPVSQFSQQYLF